MKYWGWLVAKVVGIAGFTWGTNWLTYELSRVPKETLAKDATDFDWTFTLVLWSPVILGLCWAALADQRYRCRTCATRLRMPVATGSWGRATLFGRPKMEYICPYGHGTMNISQSQITGRESPEWDEHGDMWKELESIGSSRE